MSSCEKKYGNDYEPTQSPSSEMGNFLTPRRRKATKPIQKFDKRRGRSPLAERPAWRRHPTLLNIMWWLLSAHTALWPMRAARGTTKWKLKIWLYNGNEFLPFAEGPTKTRQGGLSAKIRLVTPKMFATGNEERCPVMLVKRYLERRPSEMRKAVHFTLLSSKSHFQAFGTRKPQWVRTR